LIESVYKNAVRDGHVSEFKSDSRKTVDGTGAFSHTVLVCPDLDEKPPPPQAGTPDLTHQRDEDPFSGPDFPPGQSIAELEDHFLLNNTNAMQSEHIMAVSKSFRPQSGSLNESDLSTAYAILQAHKRQGKDVLCFYNGGPLAGASQPHLHVQFAPWFDCQPPGAEKMARAESRRSDEGVLSLLPTPHVHYIVRLPERLAAAADSGPQVFESYQRLLDVFRQGVDALPASLRPDTKAKRDSYNLLLTLEHVHLIPRRDEGVNVPHPRSRARKVAKGDDPSDVNERMTFNGFTFAGIWFVGNDAERDDLLEYGLEKVMVEAGYARTATWMPKL
jgi:ATP adenylyltransferase